MTNQRILIIVTSTPEYVKAGYRTGLWLSELTHFWDVAEAAGLPMDIASPEGGMVPLDPESLLMTNLGAAIGVEGKVQERYADRAFMDKLTNVKRIADVRADDYAAIYLTGGHGTMFDFVDNAPLAKLIADFHDAGKIVSAVCHGPAGLLDVTLSDGRRLLDGRKATGFSWREEGLAGRDHAVPFDLEAELARRGADYSKALLPYKSHVVEDGNLITGQNPASAEDVARAVVARLKGSGAA